MFTSIILLPKVFSNTILPFSSDIIEICISFKQDKPHIILTQEHFFAFLQNQMEQ